MKEIKLTRDFFLWCMSVIYLSAFASIYCQIPGLYGDNGILPARAVVPLESDADIVHKRARETPTLLWLAPVFGIDVPLMMDLIAALGVIVSFGGMIWGRMRDCANFALLWMLYFSLYQVGQTFMWFQWDILLLEAGFLTIIVAPLGLLQKPVGSGFLSSLPHRPHDTVSLWLLRWLLFRLMLASGIVKLNSMCPTWWELTALTYHFESQCIPTPVAWFAHHLPLWLLKLGVVGSFVVEIAIPFLFFIPIRSLRIFSFYSQILFQLLIIMTGNYNFFNLLTMALCLSLIDDDFLLNIIGRPPMGSKIASGAGLRLTRYLLTRVIEIITFGGLTYWTVKFFSLKLLPDWTLDSSIAFTPVDFRNAVSQILPVTICIGVLSLVGNILLAFYRSLNENGGVFRKAWSLIGTIFVSALAFWVFVTSLVPHTVLDSKTHNNLWPVIQKWHDNVEKYQIVNSYGLFRRMTGTDGRLEIVIEGSNSMTTGWKEYHFIHKPGELSDKLPFIIPHQPRLDWQMWFAALGSYNHNPWFVSLIYRLLDGQREVLDLLDKERLPFPANRPPKFIRAILYKYSYSPLKSIKKQTNNDWWTRKKVGEYFNSANLEESQMVEFLNAAGIPMEKTRYLRVTNTFLKKGLIKIRYWVSTLKATTFIWSLLSAGLTINLLAPLFRL